MKIYIEMCSLDYNEILHTSGQFYCHDMCKFCGDQLNMLWTTALQSFIDFQNIVSGMDVRPHWTSIKHFQEKLAITTKRFYYESSLLLLVITSKRFYYEIQSPQDLTQCPTSWYSH